MGEGMLEEEVVAADFPHITVKLYATQKCKV